MTLVEAVSSFSSRAHPTVTGKSLKGWAVLGVVPAKKILHPESRALGVNFWPLWGSKQEVRMRGQMLEGGWRQGKVPGCQRK